MRLGPLPDDFQFTRDQLHQIAFYAMAPARYTVEGRMGLRWIEGGFGTPEFDGRVARVEGDLLVHERRGDIATQTITTIRAAADFFGTGYRVDWFEEFRDPLPPMDPDRSLKVREEPALALGEWFHFGFEVLDELGPIAVPGDEPSEIQLWPEHFDPARELGDETAGRRASYGASPGDKAHIEPYLYVSAWSDVDRAEPYWNDRHFNGSSLPYAELLASEDQMTTALEFFARGHDLLNG
jgi:hypothetical protein